MASYALPCFNKIMAKILVISHGLFASGLINSVEMIIGKYEGILSCSLDAEEGVHGFKESLMRIFDEISTSNSKAIILCDLYCGCPYSSTVEIAASILPEQNYRIVSGVNLPMMLELCLVNQQDPDNLELLFQTAISSGVNGIKSKPMDCTGCDSDVEL